MAQTFEVRPARASDFKEWRPLWDAYNAFYGRAGPTALDPEVTRQTFERFFDPSEPMHAAVAEAQGRLIGLTHYLFHRSTLSIGPSCYLQDLFTSQASRGHGVGRALIEHVHRQAVEAGAGRLYWLTQETNETAMRLYDSIAERSGFIVYRKPV